MEFDKLEPCPFCGSDDLDPAMARGFQNGDEEKVVIAAGCYRCGSVGPQTRVPPKSSGYAESIKAWNNRVFVE